MLDIVAAPIGLDGLEARLKQDLDWLEWPSKAWVPPRFVDGVRVIDVVIVGAGMAGLVASGMLKRLGVDNHVLYDKAPAGEEGPWLSYARMLTLRSPKILTGPAMGLPALTFRAYFEARFGVEAWGQLGKIPRTMWMDYLIWYRRVLALPVENGVAVEAIKPREDGIFELLLMRGNAVETVFARHMVLATGRDGLGGPYLPPIAQDIAPRFRAHSSAAIDFATLKDKRVAVIGAGASAMDNAATALEMGAARVDLFIRRTDIPRVNKFTGIGSQGVVHGFAGLSDAWKWRFLDHTLKAQTPPPSDSVRRVSSHKNASFHLGSPILAFEEHHDHVIVITPKGRYETDFIIFATGFRVDLMSRPELAAFAPHILLWADDFMPPPGQENAELSGSPRLGESFEFLERAPGECAALSRLHCFNFPATLSHGKLSGDIPAISEGADRLARGIVRRLFIEDVAVHYANLEAFDVPEILGDEWVDADSIRDDAINAAE